MSEANTLLKLQADARVAKSAAADALTHAIKSLTEARDILNGGKQWTSPTDRIRNATHCMGVAERYVAEVHTIANAEQYLSSLSGNTPTQ